VEAKKRNNLQQTAPNVFHGYVKTVWKNANTVMPSFALAKTNFVTHVSLRKWKNKRLEKNK
jgi:hypothetical protein